MDLTLQVRDGAANKGEKKEGEKKKEENHNVSQLLLWLVDKIRAFLRIYTLGQDMLFCGDEHLGPKMRNKALRGVVGHWGVSAGDWILVHFGETVANVCFELMDLGCPHNICAFTVAQKQLCKHTQPHRGYSIRPISLLLLACLHLCRESHT